MHDVVAYPPPPEITIVGGEVKQITSYPPLVIVKAVIAAAVNVAVIFMTPPPLYDTIGCDVFGKIIEFILFPNVAVVVTLPPPNIDTVGAVAKGLKSGVASSARDAETRHWRFHSATPV